VGWIRRFILTNAKRHPREMGADEVERFLTQLATDSHVAASTQNQGRCGQVHLWTCQATPSPARVGLSFAKSIACAIASRAGHLEACGTSE
jgi:hypothetical protein